MYSGRYLAHLRQRMSKTKSFGIPGMYVEDTCFFTINTISPFLVQVDVSTHSLPGSIKQIYPTWSCWWFESSKSPQSNKTKHRHGHYITSTRSRRIRFVIATTQ